MPILAAPPIARDPELVARYDGRAPRDTSYPTAPYFKPAVGPEVYARWLGELPQDAALSIYLHVPFCERLCLYCPCNTSVVRLQSSLRAYARALLREIDRVAGLIGGRPIVSHVHWGGGTATSLPADCLIEIMGALRQIFVTAADAEVAIEIDPTALPSDRLEAMAEMDVTRVSVGVQDFEPSVQRAIGEHAIAPLFVGLIAPAPSAARSSSRRIAWRRRAATFPSASTIIPRPATLWRRPRRAGG